MEDLGTAPGRRDHLLGTDRARPTRPWSRGPRPSARLHARTHADRAAIRAPSARPRRPRRGGADRPVPRRCRRQRRPGDHRLGRPPPRARRRPGRPTSRALARALADRRPPRPQPGRRVPRQQPAARRRLPPHRLRVGGGAPPRLGRGVPRRALAHLLVLLADPRRDGRAGPGRLPRGGRRRHPVRRHRGVPRRREAARGCWALVTVAWSLTTALREDERPASRQPRHPAPDAAPPRAGGAVRHRCRRHFAGEVLEHTRSRWGDLALAARPGVPLTVGWLGSGHARSARHEAPFARRHGRPREDGRAGDAAGGRHGRRGLREAADRRRVLLERDHPLQPLARPAREGREERRARGGWLPARVRHHLGLRRHRHGARGHALLAGVARGHRRLGRDGDDGRAARRLGAARRLRQVPARHADGRSPARPGERSSSTPARSCPARSTATT